MTTSSIGARGGDVLVSYESFEFCFRSCKVKVPEGALTNCDLSDVAGYPVVISDITADEPLVATLALLATVGSINGIIIHGPAIVDEAAGTTLGVDQLFQVLVKGPAVVNEDKIQTLDINDATFTLATVKTQLTAMGIRFKDNTGLSSTQTN